MYGFNPTSTGESRSHYDPEISERDLVADEAASFVLTVLSIEGQIAHYDMYTSGPVTTQPPPPPPPPGLLSSASFA